MYTDTLARHTARSAHWVKWILDFVVFSVQYTLYYTCLCGNLLCQTKEFIAQKMAFRLDYTRIYPGCFWCSGVLFLFFIVHKVSRCLALPRHRHCHQFNYHPLPSPQQMLPSILIGTKPQKTQIYAHQKLTTIKFLMNLLVHGLEKLNSILTCPIYTTSIKKTQSDGTK